MTAEGLCVWLVTMLVDGGILYLLCSAVMAKQASVKGYLGYLGIALVIDAASMALTQGGYNGWSMLLSMLETLLFSALLFGRRGLRLITGALELFAAHLAVSLATGGFTMLFLGAERVNALLLAWTWPRLLLVACHPVVLLLLPVLHQLRWLRRKPYTQLPDGLFLARAITLLVLSILCITLLFDRLQALALSDRLTQVALLFGVAAVMIAVCVSYLTQDLRYLRLRKQHETLARQQAINQALVEDMRVFRGSVINMVDELGRTVAQGAPQAQREHYEQIAKQCALINNENILTLQRLKQPALAALLLNKLERSRSAGLPMYLQMSGDPHLASVPASVLCQAVGVLVDNAIEAASDSAAPRVGVQITAAEKGAEIGVFNTYAEAFDAEGFVRGRAGASTKPGHAGDGLRSVETLCERFPGILLNRYAHGRYIECTLTLRG